MKNKEKDEVHRGELFKDIDQETKETEEPNKA